VHNSSASHIEANEKLALILSNVSVLKTIKQGMHKNQKEATAALRAICTTILALAQTGCAIRGHDDD